MIWRTTGDPLPPDEEWCWVSTGTDVFLACRDRLAVGGWTNLDTWEDWDGDVKYWSDPLAAPSPPEVDPNI